MTTESLIDAILAREGGFVDHPDDKGGATNFGITQATLAAHRWRGVTVEDVRNLTEQEARAIYSQRYVTAPGFDRIASDPLRAALVDYAVHSGPVAAIKALQRRLGVDVDGVLGPATQRAANLEDGRRLALGVLAGRLRHLGRIITDSPSQATFAAGWMNRVAEQVEGLA